jgi:ribosomal protein L11 methyltransferase
VVANILAEIILRFTHDLPRVLVPGGIFIASGIIEEKAEQVKESLRRFGLEVLETIHLDGWVAIAAKKW